VILGLELHEGTVTAVSAAADGRVRARATRPGSDAAAAADAIRELAGEPASHLGIAVRDPAAVAASGVAAAAAGAGHTRQPARLVTRATAVALAEQWCGAASDASHVVALTAGDRVHAGIVIDGRPFEGAHGLAGAAGWLSLNPVEREDYRKIGCLEAEIGAAGIVRRLVWRLKSGDRSRVLDMADGDISAITLAQVFAAARERDGVAVSVVRDTARYIGMAIGNLVAVVDPQVIVLDGLMADAADLLLEPARAEAARRMPAHVSRAVRIDAAALGADAGALGAARAAMLAT
jgi:glucokinase